MAKRSLWLSIILLGMICLGTAAMLHHGHYPLANNQQQLDRRPDAFMLDVNYNQYDEKGLLHSHLITPKVVHYPRKNTSRFTSPDFVIYTDQRIPWHITANYGTSQNGIDLVFLHDNVVFHQPQQSGNPTTTIKTTSSTIFPKQSLAKTQQPVTLIRPGSTIHATGMVTHFTTGIVELLSHSEAVYEPAAVKNTKSVAEH